jgi:hypothetical protein
MRKFYLILYIFYLLTIQYYVDGVLTGKQLTKNRQGTIDAWTSIVPSQSIISSISPDQHELAAQQLQRQQLAAQQLAKRILPGLDPEIGPQYHQLVQEVTRLTALTVKTTVNGKQIIRSLTDTEVRKNLQLRFFEAASYIAEGSIVPSEDFIGVAELNFRHIEDMMDLTYNLIETLEAKVQRIEQNPLPEKLYTAAQKDIDKTYASLDRAVAMFEDVEIQFQHGRYAFVERYLTAMGEITQIVQKNIKIANAQIDKAYLIIGCNS